MEKRKRVLELRDRLDRTLALPDLAEESLLRALVNKQILASSLSGSSDEGDIDLIAETRTKEVSEFLEMLNTSKDRGSSKVRGVQQKEWKVKQDTDQLRVMYREGPEGPHFTPCLLKALLMDLLTSVHVCHGNQLYTKNGPPLGFPHSLWLFVAAGTVLMEAISV